METLRIPAAEAGAIPRALAILHAGGLVAFPTDTVYGVGCLAFDGIAIESIYAAKARPPEKAIPVLISDVEELEKVAGEVPLMARRLAARFWPGPLTLIVPRAPALPPQASATDTIAVRVPDHPVARLLLHLAGPLAVTSANLSGKPSPVTAGEVLSQLGGRIPLILDGGETPGGLPSTLVDCMGERPLVLREGPLSLGSLLEALAAS
ncbi:MAG: L-threonylcarbamoyladenylate synthase [Bacteroidota bacterium]